MAEWQILCFARSGRSESSSAGLECWLWTFFFSHKPVNMSAWSSEITRAESWRSVMKKGDESHWLPIDPGLWYKMAPTCCYEREMWFLWGPVERWPFLSCPNRSGEVCSDVCFTSAWHWCVDAWRLQAIWSILNLAAAPQTVMTLDWPVSL